MGEGERLKDSWVKPVQPKKKWKKILFISVTAVVVLCVAAFLAVNLYMNRSLPLTSGEVELPKLKQTVTVTTDKNGVPHIDAKNEHDLYMAQGYIQAQFRMFQMELSRRQASGTLSEVVGEAAVNKDKYFRTLGLRRAAEKSYDSYSDHAKDVLQWFAEGVNSYIDQAVAEKRLPVEFTLMGTTPEKWTPIDSLTIGKYMAFDLGGHWERQAFNYYLMQEFDEDKALELFPTYPKSKPTILSDGDVDVATAFEHAVIPHAFNGSNNWVVSGEKTETGKPLLADDPHLGLATPSIWLQMNLQAPDMAVSGVIFAGVPGIILGQNEHVAWGVTNTGPDVQQLYIEKRNPDNKQEFLYEDKWEKAKVIDEPIKIKDGKTLPYEVTETRHGPIVSEFAAESGKNTVLSLRWTALDATTELEAILDLNKAKDWKEFEKGLEKFKAPAQNFVFASDDGTIAYKANGKIPVYEDGQDALLPLPGWEKKYEWKHFIPFDELPKTVNPKEGFVATANNKIASDKYPYHISNVWAQPYRYERIAEVLSSKDNLTTEDMMDLQMDQTNLQAREFVPVFLAALSDAELNDQEKKALSILKEWNFVDSVDAAQPLIFHHWYKKMEDMLYRQEIPESVMKLFEANGQTTDQLIRMAANGKGSKWIDAQGGLSKLLHDSLQKTLKELIDSYGKDMANWRWGDYHKVQFYHPLSAVNPVLAYFFNHEKPIPVGGSAVTPMAASYDDETGEVDHGASWRFVIDTNQMEESFHIVGPGQAGHFKSKWYHDQMDDWVNGDYHRTKLTNAKGDTLKLKGQK